MGGSGQADCPPVGGYGRHSGRPRQVAVGALAPRRRRPEVYRRRRLTVAGVLALVLLVPWCASRGGGGGGGADGGAGAATAVAATPEACAAAVDALPLRARLAMTLMVGVDGEAPTDAEVLLDGPTRPGGLFVRSGAAIWDARTLVPPLGDDLPLLVAVDDEGGRVQPLQGILDDLPSAATLAEESPEALTDLATDRAAALRGVGINLVFAPVVDVGSAGGIGDRSFGDTSDVVTSRAGAYAAGLREGGVMPVLKHFPGQGHADADTHESPASVPSLDLLRSSDLVPYDAILDDGPTGVMVGHLDVPGLTEGGVPASLSPAAIGLLRGGYEFPGLVVTDDLAAMQAVLTRFGAPEAAERALAAGADLLLLAQPTDVEAVLDRLEEAVTLGRIPDRRLEAALERVVEAGCPA
jgi:beta-N-acetylhexosaminidase